MKKYFNNIEEHEKTQIANICKLVESKQIFIVASGAKYKILSRENEAYTYDYTYNLIKWGFARKARNTDFFAQVHKYCPYQDFASTLAHFFNTAVELGFYTRTTEKKFDGGQDFQVIWI